MFKYLKAVLIVLIFSAVIFTGCKKNNAPDMPSIPTGPTSGSKNTEFTFTSSAEDPDNDSVAIRFDWGDGDTSGWSDWQASGDSISMSHSWSDTGTYDIKAQAKNKKDATSDWSTGHPIEISEEISAGWFKTFGGSSDDCGYSVQQTTDGGYIITGGTKSYGAGDGDVYLIKTDSTGDTLWTRTFGGSAYDVGMSVQQTIDGGYIIVGWTYSFGNLGQIYLIKTNANGDTVWTKTKGYSDCDDWGNSVQQTSDGGYIIVGRTFDHGHDAIFLIKTDANGNNQWSDIKGYDDYDDEGYSVQQTSDGGYIIVGYTKESGNGDVFLIKTDANGGGGWNKHIGGGSDDCAFSVQQTSDGGYIITGGTQSYGAGEVDVYLIKTDASGNQTWYKTFGGTAWDIGNSVQPTMDGGYIITGGTNSYGAGSGDVYLIKTDGSGNQQWHKTIGGSSGDGGNSIQQTVDGGYIITGGTTSYGAGNSDVYLIKTDANGNVE
jgi:hypothetical protein